MRRTDGLPGWHPLPSRPVAAAPVPDVPDPEPPAPAPEPANVALISRIFPHPSNVRDDLGDLAGITDSVKAHGILQPLLVQPHPQKDGCYIVLAGHRRLEAARRAGLQEVPVTIRHGVKYETALELMLVENLQRADLNPMDKAEAMGQLKMRGHSVIRIAEAIGLSDAAVYQYLALLELDQSSREKVRAGELTKSDAFEAVTRTRKRRRAAGGMKNRSAAVASTWEPDHFTWDHPLARKAAGLCAGRDHTMRRRIGRVACGECFETVIRADERVVCETLGGAA